MSDTSDGGAPVGGLEADFAAAEKAFAEMGLPVEGEGAGPFTDDVDFSMEDFEKSLHGEPEEGAEEGAVEPDEDEALEAAAAEEDKAEEPKVVLGSRENPYTEKTLPEDMYVRVPVDGQEEVITLKEAAKGVMMQKTFHRRLNKSHEDVKSAHEYVSKVNALRETERNNFLSKMGNDQELYMFMDKWFPDVLDKVATARAKHMVQVDKMHPSEQRAYYENRSRRRYEAQVQMQSQRLNQLEQERQIEAAKSEWGRLMHQPMTEVMGELGVQKIPPEPMELIRLKLRATVKSGGSVTPELIKETVRRAMRAYSDPESDQERAPATRAAKKQVPRERERKGRSGRRKQISDWTPDGILRDL